MGNDNDEPWVTMMTMMEFLTTMIMTKMTMAMASRMMTIMMMTMMASRMERKMMTGMASRMKMMKMMMETVLMTTWISRMNCNMDRISNYHLNRCFGIY